MIDICFLSAFDMSDEKEAAMEAEQKRKSTEQKCRFDSDAGGEMMSLIKRCLLMLCLELVSYASILI